MQLRHAHTRGGRDDDEEPAPFSAQSGSGLSLLAGWFSPAWLNPAPLELDRQSQAQPFKSRPPASPTRASVHPQRLPHACCYCACVCSRSVLSRTFVIPVSCAQPSSRPRYPARQRLGVCLPRRQVVVVINHHLPDLEARSRPSSSFCSQTETARHWQLPAVRTSHLSVKRCEPISTSLRTYLTNQPSPRPPPLTKPLCSARPPGSKVWKPFVSFVRYLPNMTCPLPRPLPCLPASIEPAAPFNQRNRCADLTSTGERLVGRDGTVVACDLRLRISDGIRTFDADLGCQVVGAI